MTHRSTQLSAWLLFLYAFLWPWELYHYIPWLGVYGTSLIGTMLATLLIYDILRHHHLHVPFEFIVPVLGLLVVVLLHLMPDASAVTSQQVGMLLLFSATVHFGRNRQHIQDILWISMLSGAGAALWTIAARHAAVLPTTYSPHTKAVFAFSRDLSGGMLTLVIGSMLAFEFFFLAKRAGISRFGRVGLLLLAHMMGIAAIPICRSAATDGWWQPPLFDCSRSTLPGLLMLLWLAARILGKVHIVGREEKASYPLRGLLLRTLCAAVVFCLCFQVSLSAPHAFLLGIAAAYMLPEKNPASSLPAWRYALLLPFIALLSWNALHVYPDNPSDTRNYELAAQCDFDVGQLDSLEQHMAFIKHYAPDERRPHLWQARAALIRQYPYRAAIAFAQAVRDETAEQDQILPLPTRVERDGFLDWLRDVCSSSKTTDQMLAFEYALVADENPEAALDSLRHRMKPRRTNRGDVSSTALAHALAFLLGDATLVPLVAEWPATELLAALRHCGATILPAPETLHKNLLPLVVTARATPDGLALFCQSSEGTQAQHLMSVSPATQHAQDMETPVWTPLLQMGNANWRMKLRLSEETVAARVCLSGDGNVEIIPQTSPTGMVYGAPVTCVYLAE